jgi:hypothetical protein
MSSAQINYRKKRLADVEVGDVLADIDGEPARVISKTPIHMTERLYKIVFSDPYGRLNSVKADAEHVWPLADVSWWVDEDGNEHTDATTSILNEWYLEGRRAVLAPMKGSEDIIAWTVYSCYPTDASEVQCIEVDSPTHTFLLASNDADSVLVDPNRFRVMEESLPTHNCGGPLALDTIVPLFDGGYTTMGEIQVGDKIVSQDETMTTVLETSEVMRAEELWEIEFEEVTA